jgi:F-type H+-transporting ATPase subunit delta
VSDTSSLTSGVAGRYATALFEIANEASTLTAVEADLSALEAALAESGELRELISSPIYTREQQAAVMDELSAQMKIGKEVANTVALMASKRRLFVLPELIAAVKALAAEARGEISADVTAAKALTKAQQESLAKALSKSSGKDVTINMSVDKDIIGGLIVKMGSKMIDTSVASKLANLQNAMKEVG